LEDPVHVLRLRRNRPEVVAVTGATGGLGRALVDRLATHDELAGLLSLESGLREPLLSSRLSGATTVVHLDTSYDVTLPAAIRRAQNVRGTAQLLEAARDVGARRVVLCTSADVYGVRADNPVPLPDDTALSGEADELTLVGDHVEVERLASHTRRTGLPVTVLRPATLVGLGPSYDGQLLRQLSAPRLLAVRGIEPQWQLCHVEDLLSALELAALGVVSGGLGVSCEGALPQAVVEELTGRRRLELPAAVALSTAARLHRVGLTSSSPRELDHLLGPLVLGCDGLFDAGWKPTWTNEDALLAHLTARAADAGRGSAVTAASATVALLGTAALVRQARRRRRGL
jgi:nucleoside-diphosphate-sugar epimerase